MIVSSLGLTAFLHYGVTLATKNRFQGCLAPRAFEPLVWNPKRPFVLFFLSRFRQAAFVANVFRAAIARATDREGHRLNVARLANLILRVRSLSDPP